MITKDRNNLLIITALKNITYRINRSFGRIKMFAFNIKLTLEFYI